MEIAAAQRMNATTITLPTCHLAMLEQPDKVAEAIEDAALVAAELRAVTE
ncbi:MAG: hypothetical protein JWL69_4594 [Phycisphaerales bacterium]|nr:hypothetical protein [Phycisphaerales bacterium]MDB5358281.1 hypothetical protein [Phycisphaerales bacterium]